MGLTGFSLSMLTMLLVFVPPETVRRLANALKEQFQPLVEAFTYHSAQERAVLTLQR
jgi:hypothetical protein